MHFADTTGIKSPGKEARYEPLLRWYMPELDSIRGIAILGVLFYHGLYWNVDLSHFSRPIKLILTALWAGRLGVDLFFVLSGFLITGLLMGSKSRPDYYSRFYVRRALRILPAYCLTMCVLVITAYAPWKFIVLSTLYLSNLTPLFGIPIAYPVLWSLAVEEHFYFLWPAIVRRFSASAMLVLCLFLIVVSPFSRLITFLVTAKHGPVSFVCNEYTWNAADGLASGALLMIWIKSYTPSRSILKIALMIAAVIGISIWAIGLPWGIWTRERPVGAALQVVPWHLWFVALLGAFLLLGTGPLRHYVQCRPLRFFGDISYGLYLYHLLFFNLYDYMANRLHLVETSSSLRFLLFRFLIVSVVAVTASYVSRKWFENPFLSLKQKLTPD